MWAVLKIDKNMATMITIGATASGNAKGVDATGFSKFNAGTISVNIIYISF